MADTVHNGKVAASGDPAAFGHMLERHLPAVRSFVRALMGARLRARESASDVVQSVCCELMTRTLSFRAADAQALRAWLYATARYKVKRRARDLGRKKRDVDREVAVASETELHDLGAAGSAITGPDAWALRREEVHRLAAAIDRLPQEQRDVLTLAHLSGMSRAEIAHRIGKTEVAVRAMLLRAKARLAILLTEGSRGP